MATQTTLLAPLSDEMKTFYDRVLLERATPLLVHSQFGQERPIPPRGGKTIEFRRFTTLGASTTALTEGVTPAGQALDVTAVTATISQYGDFVEGSDLLDLTAIDPVLTETAQLLGEQAGESLDTIVRDILHAGTTVQYADAATSRATVAAGHILTVNEVRQAVRTLKTNKARPLSDGNYVAIVGPSTTYDLQSDTKWVETANYAGGSQIFAGEIGRIYGVRFVETTQAKTFAGAGAAGIDVHSTLVIGQNAYGIVPLTNAGLQFIFNPVGSAGSADPLAQRWSSAWKAAQTAKILNDLFMVRIEHAVSA